MDSRIPDTRKLSDKVVAGLEPADKIYDVWDSEIKGFLVRVSTTGNKSFRLSYRNQDGKRQTFTIGRFGNVTTAQARDIAKTKIGQVITGIDVQAEERSKVIQRTLTLSEFIEQHYAAWRAVNRKNADLTLNRIKLNFYPAFRNTALDKITVAKVEHWRTKKLSAGVSKETTNRDIADLRSALNSAATWDLIKVSPLNKLKASKVDRSPKVRYLSVDEEKALRLALQERDQKIRDARARGRQHRIARGHDPLPPIDQTQYGDHITPMVLVSILTGMRQGELFGLRWQNVDFDRRVITIEGDDSKSGQTRHIPMNKECFAVMQQWQSQQPNTVLVFTSDDGQPFNNVKKAWANLLKSAGIESFRWHDLRHHFASRLVMAGADLNTVRELLGHSSIAVTLRYAHLAHEHKAKAVALLDD